MAKHRRKLTLSGVASVLDLAIAPPPDKMASYPTMI
jgi:hypothetical protein